MPTGAMPTTRGLDRLVFFTDAVVAIAATLLILPLVEAASDSAQSASTAARFFVEEGPQIVAFLISFAVIARLWAVHHSLFEHVVSHNGRMILLSLVWAFTIVVLPLPTVMSAELTTEALVLGFYVGTMCASSLLLTLLALTIRGDSQLESQDNPVSAKAVRGIALITVLFAVALVVGVLTLSYWALLVLFLAIPLDAVLDRQTARRDVKRSR